jgi:hypothetical protein
MQSYNSVMHPICAAKKMCKKIMFFRLPLPIAPDDNTFWAFFALLDPVALWGLFA